MIFGKPLNFIILLYVVFSTTKLPILLNLDVLVPLTGVITVLSMTPQILKSINYWPRDNQLPLIMYLFITLSFIWGQGAAGIEILIRLWIPFLTFMVASSNMDTTIKIPKIITNYFYLTLPISLLLLTTPMGWMVAHDGEIMGVGLMTHKNTLGLFSALSILWFSIKLKKSTPHIILIIVSVVLLLTSKSKTSLVLTLVSLLYYFFLYPQFIKKNDSSRIKNNLKQSLGIWLVGCVIFVIVLWSSFAEMSVFSYVLKMLGKDPTLTGRTSFWGHLISYGYQHHPILGAGYGNFFKSSLLNWSDEYGFNLYQAHNGYIQFFIDGGVIGLILLVTLIVKRVIDTKKDTLAFTLILFFVLYNLYEANFFAPNISIWFLLFAICKSTWTNDILNDERKLNGHS